MLEMLAFIYICNNSFPKCWEMLGIFIRMLENVGKILRDTLILDDEQAVT